MIEGIFLQVSQYTGAISIPVEKWKFDFLQLRQLIVKPRPITEKQSDAIAFKLTVGNYTQREFKKIRILRSGVIEYLASTSSYREYFYINPNTVFWKSSKYFPANDMG